MTVSPGIGTGGAPARPAGRPIGSTARPALITVGALGTVLLIVQVVNSIMSYRLSTDFGIVPRQWNGLDGVLAAPLLHGSWGHLWSNLVPLLIFGFLIFLSGVRQFIAVTALVWLVSGLGVWLAGPAHGVTVGASAVVFGWLAYLITRGIFTRSVGQIVIGIVLLAMYGGVFWTGILRIALAGDTARISWQGHLFGALAGVLAAFLLARSDRRGRRPAPAGQLPAGK